MSDETPVEAAPRSRRRWWITLVTVAFLVGYPLSVGPIVFVIEKFPGILSLIEPVLAVVYAPLEILYEKSPLVRDFYDWYTPLWGFDASH